MAKQYSGNKCIDVGSSIRSHSGDEILVANVRDAFKVSGDVSQDKIPKTCLSINDIGRLIFCNNGEEYLVANCNDAFEITGDVKFANVNKTSRKRLLYSDGIVTEEEQLEVKKSRVSDEETRKAKQKNIYKKILNRFEKKSGIHMKTTKICLKDIRLEGKLKAKETICLKDIIVKEELKANESIGLQGVSVEKQLTANEMICLKNVKVEGELDTNERIGLKDVNVENQFKTNEMICLKEVKVEEQLEANERIGLKDVNVENQFKTNEMICLKEVKVEEQLEANERIGLEEVNSDTLLKANGLICLKEIKVEDQVEVDQTKEVTSNRLVTREVAKPSEGSKNVTSDDLEKTNNVCQTYFDWSNLSLKKSNNAPDKNVKCVIADKDKTKVQSKCLTSNWKLHNISAEKYWIKNVQKCLLNLSNIMHGINYNITSRDFRHQEVMKTVQHIIKEHLKYIYVRLEYGHITAFNEEHLLNELKDQVVDVLKTIDAKVTMDNEWMETQQRILECMFTVIKLVNEQVFRLIYGKQSTPESLQQYLNVCERRFIRNDIELPMDYLMSKLHEIKLWRDEKDRKSRAKFEKMVEKEAARLRENNIRESTMKVVKYGEDVHATESNRPNRQAKKSRGTVEAEIAKSCPADITCEREAGSNSVATSCGERMNCKIKKAKAKIQVPVHSCVSGTSSVFLYVPGINNSTGMYVQLSGVTPSLSNMKPDDVQSNLTRQIKVDTTGCNMVQNVGHAVAGKHSIINNTLPNQSRVQNKVIAASKPINPGNGIQVQVHGDQSHRVQASSKRTSGQCFRNVKGGRKVNANIRETSQKLTKSGNIQEMQHKDLLKKNQVSVTLNEDCLPGFHSCFSNQISDCSEQHIEKELLCPSNIKQEPLDNSETRTTETESNTGTWQNLQQPKPVSVVANSSDCSEQHTDKELLCPLNIKQEPLDNSETRTTETESNTGTLQNLQQLKPVSVVANFSQVLLGRSTGFLYQLKKHRVTDCSWADNPAENENKEIVKAAFKGFLKSKKNLSDQGERGLTSTIANDANVATAELCELEATEHANLLDVAEIVRAYCGNYTTVFASKAIFPISEESKMVKEQALKYMVNAKAVYQRLVELLKAKDTDKRSVWSYVKITFVPRFMHTRSLSFDNWVYVKQDRLLERKCNICGQVIDRILKQCEHAIQHRFMCRICNEEFEFKHLFHQHFVFKHFFVGRMGSPDLQLFLDSPSTACGLCEEKHTASEHLELCRDKEMKTCEKVICSKCDYQLLDRTQSNIHERLHRYGEKGSPFSCGACKEVFWYKNTLLLHYAVSSDCGAKVLGLSHMSRDTNKAHENKDVLVDEKVEKVTTVTFKDTMVELLAQKRMELFEQKQRLVNEIKRRKKAA